MARHGGTTLAGLSYTVVILAPLGLAATQHSRGQGLWVNLSVALGFVALSVLGFQGALGARLPWMTRRFGSVFQFHRQMTLLATLAALGHPALLFVFDKDTRPLLLNVLHAPLRAQLGWLSVAALVLLILTSTWRRALRLSYGTWHILHSTLALVIVGAALWHAFLVDKYTSTPLVRDTWIVYGIAFAWLTVYVRVFRPILLWGQAWRVSGLHPEPGDSLTVTLKPRRASHAEFPAHGFEAGQFAWLHVGRNPWSLTWHPFSLASSADNNWSLDFTIKRVGGFTGQLRGLSIGDRVYLDGPHGGFTLRPAPGLVFLAAGIGVTPILSMLETLADRRDKRPCLLLLGNRNEWGITGVRQLHGLDNRLNLTVVHVISQPSTSWTGERGRITSRLLNFYLPGDHKNQEFFVCASPAPARAYRSALLKLGVPSSRIHTEQFASV